MKRILNSRAGRILVNTLGFAVIVFNMLGFLTLTEVKAEVNMTGYSNIDIEITDEMDEIEFGMMTSVKPMLAGMSTPCQTVETVVGTMNSTKPMLTGTPKQAEMTVVTLTSR